MRQLGLIGLGRMGSVLAERLADRYQLAVFDRDEKKLTGSGEKKNTLIAGSLADAAECGAVILAVPDGEIVACVDSLNQVEQPLLIINIATNITRHMLAEKISGRHCGVGVKFIGHAHEWRQGAKPVIVIDDNQPAVLPLLYEVFAPLGQVIAGDSDRVSDINKIAACEALTAGVRIERRLLAQGIENQSILTAAVEQVAAGILKAYAGRDLGPFAQGIVEKVYQT